MTLEQAIEHLRKEYERAKSMEYIINPLAYALYKVWIKAAETKITKEKIMLLERKRSLVAAALKA